MPWPFLQLHGFPRIAHHMVSALRVGGGRPMHALVPDFASTMLSLHPVSPLKHEPKSLLQFGETPIIGGGEFLIGLEGSQRESLCCGVC